MGVHGQVSERWSRTETVDKEINHVVNCSNKTTPHKKYRAVVRRQLRYI